jgi:SAM-dependent methyltransferase
MISIPDNIQPTHYICRACSQQNLMLQTRLREVALYRCRQCSTLNAYDWQAELELHNDHFQGLDLQQYFRSVKATRERSYASLHQHVQKHVPTGTWLDVGCSYGWLLAHMAQHGYEVSGVEPSHEAAVHATQQGHKIWEGLYPAVVPEGEKFNIISFMDVLEHLSNPLEILQITREKLHSQGLVVIQVPDQACWLYRSAQWMHWGSGGRMNFALRRLWLLDFDFPHQTYFTAAGLTKLLQQAKLKCVSLWRSPIGSPREAFDRVSYARQSGFSLLANSTVACGVAGIQIADMLSGHGGLITLIAQAEDG